MLYSFLCYCWTPFLKCRIGSSFIFIFYFIAALCGCKLWSVLEDLCWVQTALAGISFPFITECFTGRNSHVPSLGMASTKSWKPEKESSYVQNCLSPLLAMHRGRYQSICPAHLIFIGIPPFPQEAKNWHFYGVLIKVSVIHSFSDNTNIFNGFISSVLGFVFFFPVRLVISTS